MILDPNNRFRTCLLRRYRVSLEPLLKSYLHNNLYTLGSFADLKSGQVTIPKGIQYREHDSGVKMFTMSIQDQTMAMTLKLMMWMTTVSILGIYILSTLFCLTLRVICLTVLMCQFQCLCHSNNLALGRPR